MHEESERQPLHRRCHPIERNEVAPRVAGTGVHIELLDGFACDADGATVDLAPSAQRLLAFVALQGGRAGRGVVITALWPERDDQRGGGNLRSVIWRLPEPVRSAVRLHNSEVSLDASCDAVELIIRARQLLEGTDALDELSPASFGADLLPGWYDDWVLVERERLRQIRVHALEELSRRFAVVHRYGDAIDAALAAIAADPLRESGRLRLIEAHLGEGNASEAIREYDTYAWLLSSQLGIKPSPALSRLVDLGTRVERGGDSLVTPR